MNIRKNNHREGLGGIGLTAASSQMQLEYQGKKQEQRPYNGNSLHVHNHNPHWMIFFALR